LPVNANQSAAAGGCQFLRLYPESAAEALSDEVFRLIGVEIDQDESFTRDPVPNYRLEVAKPPLDELNSRYRR